MKAPREEEGRIIAQSRFDVNQEIYEQDMQYKTHSCLRRSMSLNKNDSSVPMVNVNLLKRCFHTQTVISYGYGLWSRG